jgi:uroporphyrinogen III methyltransferase/synthase
MPTLDIGPPPDPAAVDRMLDRLPEFQWLVFTSANGVESLLGGLLERGHDLRRLGALRLAAIGTQTAAALARFHLRADVIPTEFTSEGLSAALAPLVRGQRVLLARADRGRQVLLDVLQPLCQVEQTAVYSQMDATELDPTIAELIRQGQLDFVTFTSSNNARAFFRLLGPAEKASLASSAQLVSISPVTSAAIRECGFEPAAEAREYTAEGVIEAVVERAAYLSSRRVSMQT